MPRRSASRGAERDEMMDVERAAASSASFFEGFVEGHTTAKHPRATPEIMSESESNTTRIRPRRGAKRACKEPDLAQPTKLVKIERVRKGKARYKRAAVKVERAADDEESDEFAEAGVLVEGTAATSARGSDSTGKPLKLVKIETARKTRVRGKQDLVKIERASVDEGSDNEGSDDEDADDEDADDAQSCDAESNDEISLAVASVPADAEIISPAEHAVAAEPGSHPAPQAQIMATCCVAGCTDKAGTKNKCHAHGGRVRCSMKACPKQAHARGKCTKHGGCRRCSVDGCASSAASGSTECKKHGGGERCAFDGCSTAARNGYATCCKHGGGRRCSVDGCASSAVSDSTECKKHGGGRRCSVDGCPTAAISGYAACTKHGGGHRCSSQGCTKLARAAGLCRSHGRQYVCKAPKCGRRARDRGFCQPHAQS